MAQTKSIIELKKGEGGIITEIENGPHAQRLIEMGLTPGTFFEIRSISPFGDPIAIRLNDFAISLRLKDARGIRVEKVAQKEQKLA